MLAYGIVVRKTRSERPGYIGTVMSLWPVLIKHSRVPSAKQVVIEYGPREWTEPFPHPHSFNSQISPAEYVFLGRTFVVATPVPKYLDLN